MSDKKKFTGAIPKTPANDSPKRPSTVGASTSRKVSINKVPVKAVNVKPSKTRNSRVSITNTTVLQEDMPSPKFDKEYLEMAYGDFLRDMLWECIANEKIEREETQMDIQMAHLADEFQKTVDVLDKTSRKVKDIKFVVEQERLLKLKEQDCTKFYDTTDSFNVKEPLQDLSNIEQAHLDTLTTKNIDFGYNKDTGSELTRQLDLWLSKADLTHGPARAIIAPHAGYSYCGACAAYAYRQVSPVVVKRIFILGPSHHVRLGGCALSSMDKYQTPLYDLTIDKQIYAELESSRQFEWMDQQTDEDEHSIEMHLPYIAKVMDEYRTGFTIIPILVGSLTKEKEAKYGAILAPYLADPQNLFVISSDFCHWGSRFRYTWRDHSAHIHQSIEWLDKQGMDIIEAMDPRAFTEYLNKYSNTICGRHPIGVLLQAISKLRSQSQAPKMSLKFLKYAQSSQCMSMQDSSVSYASASLIIE